MKKNLTKTKNFHINQLIPDMVQGYCLTYQLAFLRKSSHQRVACYWECATEIWLCCWHIMICVGHLSWNMSQAPMYSSPTPRPLRFRMEKVGHIAPTLGILYRWPLRVRTGNGDDNPTETDLWVHRWIFRDGFFILDYRGHCYFSTKH